MAVKPILQALVLSDHVYADQATGKKVIAGTFDSLWAREFPAKLARTTWFYLSVTDVQGSVEFSLKYTDLSNNEVLLSAGFCLSSNDRLATRSLVCEIPPLPMPHPGAYAFEVFVGDEMLGSLRIVASKLEDKKES